MDSISTRADDLKKKIKNGQRRGAAAKRRTIGELIQEWGSVAQFARDLSRVSGEEVTWARVNNWILRDSVSKGMAVYVHELTRAPLTDLLR